MKDLLITFIQSTFKFILNPRIWLDLNANRHAQTIPPAAAPAAISNTLDHRDILLTKALDLASSLSENISFISRNSLASGVEELLPIKDVSEASAAGPSDKIPNIDNNAEHELSLTPHNVSDVENMDHTHTEKHVIQADIESKDVETANLVIIESSDSDLLRL